MNICKPVSPHVCNFLRSQETAHEQYDDSILGKLLKRAVPSQARLLDNYEQHHR